MLRRLIATGFALCLLPVGIVLAQDVPRPAKIMTLEPVQTSLTREFFGQVTPKSTVDLAFQTSGRLETINAVEGQFVEKDAVLAQLDLEPFNRAVKQAKVQLDQANIDLARAEELRQRNVASQSQLDEARTQAELAKVNYDDALDALDNATLSAPYDALIAKREVQAEATVSAGTPVVRIHDMSELRIEIEVPEVMFREVGTDAEITAYAEVLGLPEERKLVFRELTAEPSSVGQTYTVSFAFAQPVPRRLLPGASATVTATLSRKGQPSRTLVPANAVKFAADGTPEVLVFSPTQDDLGTLSAVSVQIETAAGGQFNLLEGPEAGSEVVATGVSLLEDGETVRRYAGLTDVEGE